MSAERAAGFSCVVGVDSVGQAEALHEHGASIVVSDLSELLED
jgi:beta-phosphoglucomutase-like phosphatase (HAD superfamily)